MDQNPKMDKNSKSETNSKNMNSKIESGKFPKLAVI